MSLIKNLIQDIFGCCGGMKVEIKCDLLWTSLSVGMFAPRRTLNESGEMKRRQLKKRRNVNGGSLWL